jgi:hypothetical protein
MLCKLTTESVLRVDASADVALKTFCRWVNDADVDVDFDLAILITRFPDTKISIFAEKSFQTKGRPFFSENYRQK